MEVRVDMKNWILVVFLVAAVIISSSCVRQIRDDNRGSEDSNSISNYIGLTTLPEMIKEERYEGLKLTIFYTNPYTYYRFPCSLESLINNENSRITIEGRQFEKYTYLLSQMLNAPVMQPKDIPTSIDYIDARIYYEFEINGQKVFDVLMWGAGGGLRVNGIDTEWNDAFLRVLLPFLPYYSASELRCYIADIPNERIPYFIFPNPSLQHSGLF